MCRFCQQPLPDWKPHLLGPKAASAAPVAASPTPHMRVNHNGRTFKVPVHPGAEGVERFKQDVKELLQLSDNASFDVIFHCKVPMVDGKAGKHAQLALVQLLFKSHTGLFHWIAEV